MDFNILDYIDNDYKISKSYLNEDGLFNTSRCRIQPCLFSNLIYEYIFTDINESELCEKYLNISRNISKSNKKYKPSNNMDTNALFRLLKIKKRKDWKLKLTYDYENIKNEIEKYINESINKNVDKSSDFFIKWINYYKYNQYKFKNILNDLNKYKDYVIDDCNIVESIEDNFCNVNNQVNYINNSFLIDEDEKYKQIIGNKGEELVKQYLMKNFKNVEHISEKFKYYPYDFVISHNNQKIYIEVKTTKNPIKPNLIISRNEFYFYEQNKNNYWLILVRNLNFKKYDKEIVPYINILKNPNIIINNKIVGFKEKCIYITPLKYSNF